MVVAFLILPWGRVGSSERFIFSNNNSDFKLIHFAKIFHVGFYNQLNTGPILIVSYWLNILDNNLSPVLTDGTGPFILVNHLPVMTQYWLTELSAVS